MATRTTTRTLAERGTSTRNPRCTRKNTYTNTYTNTNQPYPTPTLSLSPCLALPLSNTTWKNKKKNKKKNNTLRVVGLGRRCCCACARHGVTLTRRQRQRDKVKANASRRDISDATWINEIHVSSGSVKAYDKELIKQQKVGGGGGVTLSLSSLVQRTFFPDGGRDAVAEDYWGFSVWTFLKSAVSASTSVLGTQGLLRAVGIGANTSIASSAAINWVLKDGLGRIGCILAASVIGNKFDNDAKFFVFLGDMMYEFGILLEILAPTCAHIFLVVASFANAFKSMSYMSRLPPRAAILKSFAIRENVGDVSAKANSQDVVSGLFGLLLGIQISFFVGTSVWKSLVVFTISAAIVAVSSLKALSGLRLNTLNRHRMEIIIDSFVRENRIPSPLEVNREEGVLATWKKAALPQRFKCIFGASISKDMKHDTLSSLMDFYKEEEYMLSLRKTKKRLIASLFVQPEISPNSILFALLQCRFLKNSWQDKEEEFDSMLEEERAYRKAKEDFPKLVKGLEDKGWSTKHILWIPKYVLKVCDDEGSETEEKEGIKQEIKRPEVVAVETPRDPTCNTPVCETPLVDLSSQEGE